MTETAISEATIISPEEVMESIDICNDIGPSTLIESVESIDTHIFQIGFINKKEITTFIGTSGSGKTIILDDIAYNVAISGKRVLYIDFSRNNFLLTENLIVIKLKHDILDEELVSEIKNIGNTDLIVIDTPNISPVTMKKLQKLATEKNSAIVLAVQCKHDSLTDDNSVSVHPVNISYCSSRIYTLRNNSYSIPFIEINNIKHRDGIKGQMPSYYWESSPRYQEINKRFSHFISYKVT